MRERFLFLTWDYRESKLKMFLDPVKDRFQRMILLYILSPLKLAILAMTHSKKKNLVYINKTLIALCNNQFFKPAFYHCFYQCTNLFLKILSLIFILSAFKLNFADHNLSVVCHWCRHSRQLFKNIFKTSRPISIKVSTSIHVYIF